MTVTVKCQKCGTENRLGQLFCRECGAKLDLSQLKPGMHSESSVSAMTIVSRIIRVAISLALVFILGMLCWGIPAPGDAPNPQGMQLVQAKMSALRGAIMRNNEVEDVFFEADLNGHINGMLVRDDQSGGGLLKLSLSELSLDLKSDAVSVWMKTRLGPLPLTYSTDVQVRHAANGQVILNAGAVRIGHLTIPSFMKSRFTRQFVAVFSGLREEATMLNRLQVVNVVDGELRVSTIKSGAN